ncbi:hypothetical protein FJTKL_11152 [Diaporthe vaccinii]|uniref:Uncharacterized protein n=1 Tax=Diaporthe vaccinii TaxID=105482 RepID=A0ABR4EI32_9PEZI
MQVPGETWSRRKLGTRCGRAIVCSASRRGGCCSRKGGGLTPQERKLLDVAGRESWASNNGRPRKMVGEPVNLGWAAEETR